MAIPQKDIKLLWGRAASLCSLCKAPLSADKIHADGAYLTGEQAHIVGEKDDAARGKSILPPDERDSYHNLILLCPQCHTTIDRNEDDYPIERLHILKSKHELAVQARLEDMARAATPCQPFAEIVELVELLKPLLRYLHKPVPAQDAEVFLNALQEFWNSTPPVTRHFNRLLPHAIDLLLRPIACDAVEFHTDWHYGCSKLVQADEALTRYFESHGLFWLQTAYADDYRRSITTIDLNLAEQLKLAQRDQVLEQADIEALKHMRSICDYTKNFMRARKHIDIPELFTQQFFKLVNIMLVKAYHMTLPDAFDTVNRDKIEGLFRSHPWE
jgi:hypothetical protein